MSVTLSATRLPSQLDSFFTATGALAMREKCAKSGKSGEIFDAHQVSRVFAAARRISFGTLITAEDVARAWEACGVRETVIPHVNFV